MSHVITSVFEKPLEEHIINYEVRNVTRRLGIEKDIKRLSVTCGILKGTHETRCYFIFFYISI